MSAIGTLRPNGNRLEGQITTLQFSGPLFLEPNPRKRSDREPSHDAFTSNADGELVRIGAAWTKAVTAAGREGEEYLSITLDDPSFPAPLNIAAFKSEEPGVWNVTWRRRQARTGKAA